MKSKAALKLIRQLDEASRLMLNGRTKFGKSYFLKRLIEERWIGRNAVVVWDLQDEYSAEKDGPCEKRVTVAQLQAMTAQELEELFLDPTVSVAVVPVSNPDNDKDGLAGEFDWFANTIVKWRGDCVLVVEEVGAFKGRVDELLESIATRWRHFGVLLVLVAQFATQVCIEARKQCGIIVSFNQAHSADLRQLSEQCGARFARRVRRLGKGECEVWDADAPLDDGCCEKCGALPDAPAEKKDED